MQPIILVALEDELPQAVLPKSRIIYTGVGKVNAALVAARVIQRHTPKLILNFGTAGTLSAGLTGLQRVNRLYQRDMDVRGLGVPLGVTPFEDGDHIDLGGAGVSCGTGDSFVQSAPELRTDLVDMEAFAIAKACEQSGVAFICLKYVSDNADGGAAKDWSASMQKGAGLFKDWYLNQTFDVE